MRRLGRLVRALPTLLGAGVLGACAAMLIFNMVAGTVLHANGIRFWSYPLFGALKGVTEKSGKQRLTMRTFLNGSFQADYARQVGPRVPIYEFAVRLRNQVEFSALDVSAIPAIIVGADSELIEHVYTDDYCSRDLAAFLPGARAWAAHIREMQDAVERRGQTFLYVVTPSKIGQYPAVMPRGLPCPAAPADQHGLVPAWIGLVRAAGVHVTDTTAVVAAAHGRYPFRLWPQDGTHWNAVGGMLAGQSVAAELSRLRDDPALSPRGFQWHYAAEPSGADIDLAVLMNLLWLPTQDPTPEIELDAAAGTSPCRPLKVVMVGGSFAHAIGDALSRQRCHPDVMEYEYWHNFVLTWDDGDMEEQPFNAAQRARDLNDAGVVLYEDNEQMLGRSEHGRALYEYLIGREP